MEATRLILMGLRGACARVLPETGLGEEAGAGGAATRGERSVGGEVAGETAGETAVVGGPMRMGTLVTLAPGKSGKGLLPRPACPTWGDPRASESRECAGEVLRAPSPEWVVAPQLCAWVWGGLENSEGSTRGGDCGLDTLLRPGLTNSSLTAGAGACVDAGIGAGATRGEAPGHGRWWGVALGVGPGDAETWILLGEPGRMPWSSSLSRDALFDKATSQCRTDPAWGSGGDEPWGWEFGCE